MTQPKPIKQEQDFRFNKILNVKVHPLSNAQRLAMTLGTGDAGLQVFDLDIGQPYFWSGTTWITGSVDLTKLVFDEVPQGSIDGFNNIFQSINPFIPGQVDVFLNGLRQTLITDYTTIGTNTVTLNFSPGIGEIVTLNYIKQ